ncbi:alpha/beta fold hydrolase [Nocardia violaceofusca]|uniref:alpha/beta fold hydrolase n=1 Tax=Nocardia violaceofusca TaxID=941182 RepID=UPI001E5020A6|nr:alpha/beta hydrolase [Nocardia violaceofusca]
MRRAGVTTSAISALSRSISECSLSTCRVGGSDPVHAGNFDHVETLLQFLDALDIEKAAVVGNSMGGATAIRFAAEHPDRISHLVTMGAPSGPRPGLFGPGGLSEGIKVLLRGYQDPSEANIRQLVEVMTYDHATITEELVQRRTADTQAHPEHLTNFLSLAAQRKGPIPKWPTVELSPVSGHPPCSFTGVTTVWCISRTRSHWSRPFRTRVWCCSTAAAIGRRTSTPKNSIAWSPTSSTTTEQLQKEPVPCTKSPSASRRSPRNLDEQAAPSDDVGRLTDETAALLRSAGIVRMLQAQDRGG